MRLKQLFPHLAGLRIDDITIDNQGVVLTVRATRRTAPCPVCGHRSARVHGRYSRSLADRPCAGRQVTLRLHVRRFNRRLHRLAHWFAILLDLLGEAFAGGALFIIDSMPLPVCRRARAWRCRKVRGAEYCGYCAAKKEKFFGWRLHLVATPDGIPVSFDLLPASYHDLTDERQLPIAGGAD